MDSKILMKEGGMALSRREKIIVLIAATLIAATWWLNAAISRPGFDHLGAMSDLVNIQIYLQKADNPQLYPTDYLFESAEGARQYTPSYRWMVSALSRVSGGFGNALVMLVPVLAFVYVLTMTIFLRNFTSSILLAILLAAVSSVPHYAPGNTFWGTGGIYSALPRSVFTSVAPLLMLVHLRYASSLRGSAFSLGLVGLAANLHPPSGAILAQLFLIERAMASLWHKFPWKGIVLSAGSFFIGAFPFILVFFSIAGKSTATTPSVDPAAFYTAISLRFNGNLLPLSREVMWSFAEAFLPLVLFAVLGVVTLKKDPPQKQDAIGILRLFAVLMLVILGGQIVLQILARNVGWSFLVIDQLRGLRFVYPLALALAAIGLESIRTRVPILLRAPAALAAALFMLPAISLPSLTPTRMYLPQPASAAYWLLTGKIENIRQEFQLPPVKPRTLAMEASARWARENTSDQALFLCDDGRFRLLSQRSVAFAYKDGGTCYYLGKNMFMEWAHREAAVRKVRKSRSLNAWTSLAKDLNCDFVLVDKTKLDDPIVSEAVYQNDIFALVPVGKNKA